MTSHKLWHPPRGSILGCNCGCINNRLNNNQDLPNPKTVGTEQWFHLIKTMEVIMNFHSSLFLAYIGHNTTITHQKKTAKHMFMERPQMHILCFQSFQTNNVTYYKRALLCLNWEVTLNLTSREEFKSPYLPLIYVLD